MYKKMQKEMIKKDIFTLHVDIAIDSNGNYIAYPMGEGFPIVDFRKGNFNELSDKGLSNLIEELLTESLNREKYVMVKETGNSKDEFYKLESDEYKKDRCQSMKLITIRISSNYPDKMLIIDNICTGKHIWGGGKYVHFLPIDAKEKEVVELVRKIYEYTGHMPGASSEEQKNIE